ncbi:MAG: RNA polymerase sigma factor SigJ [Pseudomonadota bacterium]
MQDRDHIQVFESVRPSLLGLAYRMLGSMADAEDAVQDTFLKWSLADRSKIENGAAWLSTTCTRRCLDLLRAAHRSRVDYVGAWLPEPIHTPVDSDADAKLDLATSLTTAFLLMLERLTPKERAAYLLHDVFDHSYREISETLDADEAACRKLVSRARANIGCDTVRQTVSVEHQNRLLAAFQNAVATGATTQLAMLLSDDVRLRADGGGKVLAALNVLHGPDRVLAFVAKGLRKYWTDFRWQTADLNGARGLVLEHQGVAVAAVSFGYNAAGKASDIYIVRNPDKLGNLSTMAFSPRPGAL